jgi:hypothetical protein
MRVPRVDKSVIYGEGWEDGDSNVGNVKHECEGRYIDRFNGDRVKGRREGRGQDKRRVKSHDHADLLYAQEDVAAIGNILEGRVRMREEKKLDSSGGLSHSIEGLLATSKLAREIGEGLEGDGEVRVFSQVKAERYDGGEIRDTASVMLMSSIAMGEGM